MVDAWRNANNIIIVIVPHAHIHHALFALWHTSHKLWIGKRILHHFIATTLITLHHLLSYQPPADQESRLVPEHSDRQKPLPPPKQRIEQDISDGGVAAGPIGVPAAYHSFSAMGITKKHNNSGPATEKSVLRCKNQRHHSTTIMNSSSVCPCSFPCQEDCPHVALQWGKEVQVHKSSYFVMAAAPTLVWVLERRTTICWIAQTIPCLLRQEDRGGGRASNGAECTWCGGQWETQTAVHNRSNVLDTSKGVQGQHGHGTMMDGTWCMGVQRGERMSQGGKGGGEGGIRDCSYTQG